MIEAIVKPQSLDNDVAVMKVLQLMGQLSLKDVKHILEITTKVYDAASMSSKPSKYSAEWWKEVEEFNKQLKAQEK
jgi:hypothetical protein